MISQKQYTEQVQALKDLNAIYTYLFDNRITYESAQTLQYLGNYNDRISFTKYVALIMQMFLLVCIGVLVIYCINYDFQSGTVKFTYSSKKPRFKILLSKLLTIAITYVGLCLLYALLIQIFSLSYPYQFTHYIDYYQGTVIGMSGAELSAKILLSVFVDTFYYLILFVLVSMLVKSTFGAVAIYVTIYVVFQMLFMSLPNTFFNAFSVSYIYIHINDISSRMYLIATAIKYAACTLLLWLATFKFLKKDLV